MAQEFSLPVFDSRAGREQTFSWRALLDVIFEGLGDWPISNAETLPRRPLILCTLCTKLVA
jgi:hypothetical protein